jgi:hypothetical protein
LATLRGANAVWLTDVASCCSAMSWRMRWSNISGVMPWAASAAL